MSSDTDWCVETTTYSAFNSLALLQTSQAVNQLFSHTVRSGVFTHSRFLYVFVGVKYLKKDILQVLFF